MEATLPQRWTRFAEEDLSTFLSCSALFAGFQVAKEFHGAKNALLPTAQRLALAARRAGPKMPLLVCSAAIGMAGMKLSIATVTHFRQDFSRDNVLMAFPVCGVLLNAHRGPRAMAKGAVALAALGYGADYVFGHYHRMQFEAAEREEEEERALLHQHRRVEGFVMEPFVSTQREL
ncbi:hypothetical protein BBJ28_00005282 [Nothophytophthora sp. Chile5]|nr:hypothetical protein BBJ28_00005282 [Nothophytophthora sp. Chile5]